MSGTVYSGVSHDEAAPLFDMHDMSQYIFLLNDVNFSSEASGGWQ